MNAYCFGEVVDSVKPEDVAHWMRRSRELSQSPVSWGERADVLRKLGAYWADPQSKERKAIEPRLPALTGFSPKMIQMALDELTWMLDPERLQQKVKTELRGGTEFQWNPETGTWRGWQPLGTWLHVLSGNVFLVGVGSWLESLVTGNQCILKMASEEREFLPAFARSLDEVDPEGVLKRTLAFLHYPSSEREWITEFQEKADGIVVWGGEAAVRAYRDGLGAGKRLVVFGPKLSFAWVTKQGLAGDRLKSVARELAREVALWDQNACTAPQACFVERGAEGPLFEALVEEMARFHEELPPGPADPAQAAEIQKLRGVAEVAEAVGDGQWAGSKGSVDWTVIQASHSQLEISPLHRTLVLLPYESVEEVETQMERWRGYLQTVGVGAAPGEVPEIWRRASHYGAVKVCELGQMAAGEIDDPHDGQYDLENFGNFVIGRFPSQDRATQPWEREGWLHRQQLDHQLVELVRRARQAPYYRDAFAGIRVRGVEDLPRLPMLRREAMEANMPPQGWGLATNPNPSGGYVSRSGGSTGEPKFSFYDRQDWEQMISHGVGLFHALGLRAGDRIANLMLAGDLYGSFVSFDHINYRVGMTNFAFAGHDDPEFFVKVWRDFKINVVEGIPVRILKLLKGAIEIEPDLRIEKVLYAGTPLAPSDRRWLHEVAGARRVASVIGANDGGQIAFQCEHQEGTEHHTVDDFNYLEIVDDNGETVGEGEPGRLLITSLRKFAFPLIRYEIGDAARFLSGTCGCGRSGRRIEYLGRADDTICVGMMNLRYRDLLGSVEGLPVSEMQVVIRNDGKGERILLNVETPDSCSTLRKAIVDRVLGKLHKVRESMEDGTIHRMDVKLFDPGELQRNARSGKLKTVLDERH